MKDSFPDAYGDVVKRVFAGWQEDRPVTHSSDVAEAVWPAATDP